MNPRVIEVKVTNDYVLDLVFTNQEKKQFDVKPYLNFGMFTRVPNFVKTTS